MWYQVSEVLILKAQEGAPATKLALPQTDEARIENEWRVGNR